MAFRAVAVALSLLVLGSLAGCDDAPAPADAAPPPAVTVATIERKAVLESETFVGRAVAVEEVDVRARVTGFLIQRTFEEGRAVKAGDLLFAIDPEPFEAARDLAAANLQRAEAALVETERRLARNRQLFERGNTSEATLDQAVADEAAARADIAARKAELHQAQINLDYTMVASPIAGVTGQEQFSIGNLVGPDSGPLATVTQLDPVHVTFSVSEALLATLREEEMRAGEPTDLSLVRLAATLPNGSRYDKPGSIDFVSPTVDRTTGTVTVRGRFPNPDGLLQPGAYVQVTVSGDAPEEQVVVPQAAVQQDQTGRFVLVVGPDDTVAKRGIETGQQVEDAWVITAGLEVGERVIVQGLQKVKPGIVVAPTEAGGA